jgi:VWFA-related protein
VVTFTDRPAIYSSFTLDRKKLKRSIDDIDEAVGGTNFWDSLNYVLQNMIVKGPESQRSAIVVMTDGIDNAITEVPGPGSRIHFETLLQNIGKSETIVFPIYLDTEEEVVNDFKKLYVSRVDYSIARQQLGRIASECATTMYKAAKLSDLDELYGQVIRDLSRVYSIGYRPSNSATDGQWRNVEVQIVERPDLVARTRKGYFAKQVSQQTGEEIK